MLTVLDPQVNVLSSNFIKLNPKIISYQEIIQKLIKLLDLNKKIVRNLFLTNIF